MDQRQWDLIQTLSESLTTSGSELKGAQASAVQVHGCTRAEDTPTTVNPPADAVAKTLCLMVEDPYFDGPASPPADSSEWAQEWTVTKAFSTPTICLQDQTSGEPPQRGPLEMRSSNDVHVALQILLTHQLTEMRRLRPLSRREPQSRMSLPEKRVSTFSVLRVFGFGSWSGPSFLRHCTSNTTRTNRSKFRIDLMSGVFNSFKPASHICPFFA